MSNTADFKTHIKKVTDSLRNIAGWILRTFRTRDKQALLTAWKTLALPIYDYCSQLWSPYSEGEKRQLEQIQWSFIRKISGLHYDDYWDALKKLGLYSLERRRDTGSSTYGKPLRDWSLPLVSTQLGIQEEAGLSNLLMSQEMLQHGSEMPKHTRSDTSQ